MEKIVLNENQSIFYFIWDNDNETIKKVNDYLKTKKDNHWSCNRCWNEDSNSDTNDTLYISKKEDILETTSFYYVGEYVVDFGNSFLGFSKNDFDSGDFIDDWYRLNALK
jgi:hypothetical protein